MDIMTLGGALLGFSILLWAGLSTGVLKLLINLHGFVIVVGGTLASVAINTNLQGFVSGVKAFMQVIKKQELPTVDESIQTIVQLSDTAHREGGIMALQNVDPVFAGGFLKRAITVAMTSGQSNETRNILEDEVRRKRLLRQEDSNFYRTMGVISPMFGLVGTLFGIIQTLSNLSDPSKIGMSMAVAITSALYGITLSNMVFVPIANKIRINAMQETMILQLVVEGVIDIMSGKPPHLIDMHLKGYLEAGTLNPQR
ncbi:MAG: MotA/TolQ/ExbB proton channel family protein [Elusimicrobiales bacterium]|nr:MotA/TolQ/ExbB proton channel family protein [Elusimicrobiales bacterium]